MTVDFLPRAYDLVDNVIIVRNDADWTQEQINALIAWFIEQYVELSVIEIMEGADRAACRFSWRDNYFQLNFECYSQSIWIEAQEQTSEQYVSSLCHYFQQGFFSGKATR